MKLRILRHLWGRLLVLGVLILLTGLWCLGGLFWAMFVDSGWFLTFQTVTWNREDLPGIVSAGPWRTREDGPGNERDIVFHVAVYFEGSALEYDQQISDDPMYARYRLQRVRQRKERVYPTHAVVAASGLALACVWWVFLRRCQREVQAAEQNEAEGQ